MGLPASFFTGAADFFAAATFGFVVLLVFSVDFPVAALVAAGFFAVAFVADFDLEGGLSF